jgi:DNA-binding LacI/PurR family transcriptional regulator
VTVTTIGPAESQHLYRQRRHYPECSSSGETLNTRYPGLFSVRIDDVAAAMRAVTHLLELGHRRIGLIGGDTEDPMRFTPPLDRRTGYRQALRAAGIALDPELERPGYSPSTVARRR